MDELREMLNKLEAPPIVVLVTIPNPQKQSGKDYTLLLADTREHLKDWLQSTSPYFASAQYTELVPSGCPLGAVQGGDGSDAPVHPEGERDAYDRDEREIGQAHPQAGEPPADEHEVERP